MPIKSFADSKTEKLFAGQHVPALAGIKDKAERKLAMLDVATALEHLSVLPGNRLEALKGDRAGQHSIRIDKQWRLCFVWKDGDAYSVEIVDYH
jgi:proteic killer suppression protein